MILCIRFRRIRRLSLFTIHCHGYSVTCIHNVHTAKNIIFMKKLNNRTSI